MRRAAAIDALTDASNAWRTAGDLLGPDVRGLDRGPRIYHDAVLTVVSDEAPNQPLIATAMRALPRLGQEAATTVRVLASQGKLVRATKEKAQYRATWRPLDDFETNALATRFDSASDHSRKANQAIAIVSPSQAVAFCPPPRTDESLRRASPSHAPSMDSHHERGTAVQPRHQHPSHPPMDDPGRARLVAAVEGAAGYFHDNLRQPGGASPQQYLRRRGFAPALETDVWAIGYAPPGWTGLTEHLRRNGYTDDELLRSGLCSISSRGNLIDRFRDRITFGIRDPGGAIVGFTARAAPSASASCPKYVNSPRTLLYDKSSLLFGLAEQRAKLANGATPVLVEGPFDTLAIALYGGPRYAPVTPCGTSFTYAQATLLRSHSGPEVLIALDRDKAGMKGSVNAYATLKSHFARMSVATLPLGSDPADLVHGGAGRADLHEALAREVCCRTSSSTSRSSHG